MAERDQYNPGFLFPRDLGHLTEAELVAELAWAESLDPETPHREVIIDNIRDFLRQKRPLTDADWEEVFGADAARAKAAADRIYERSSRKRSDRRKD